MKYPLISLKITYEKCETEKFNCRQFTSGSVCVMLN